MTDKDTDDTDEPTRDELETRVEQLEQTVQQMLPSRRDALKLGGTALAAGALGSAATGSASAGTNSVGTIGSASSPVDAELEDVNPGSVRAVEFNNNEITGVSSLSAENIANNYHFAHGYDGPDEDDRLNNALAASSDGDVILLENGTYTVDRTGANAIGPRTLMGIGTTEGTLLDADWELDGFSTEISSVFIKGGGTLTVAGSSIKVQNVALNGSIDVSADGCTISHVSQSGSVTFQSGTSAGEIGITTGQVSITDNGSNRVL